MLRGTLLLLICLLIRPPQLATSTNRILTRTTTIITRTTTTITSANNSIKSMASFTSAPNLQFELLIESYKKSTTKKKGKIIEKHDSFITSRCRVNLSPVDAELGFSYKGPTVSLLYPVIPG